MYGIAGLLSSSCEEESLCSQTPELHKFYLSPLSEVPYQGAPQHLADRGRGDVAGELVKTEAKAAPSTSVHCH